MKLYSIVCLAVALAAAATSQAADTSAPPNKIVFGVASAPAVPANFGDVTRDLVYTPITPCRIIDTRSTVEGPILANATRSFAAINSSNFTAQGGSSTNCGTPGLNASVVMVVATAVTPTAAGSATVFAYGGAQPIATSMQFAAGAISVNTLAVQIPNPRTTFDLSVYTSAQSHFVFDIVGYYAPPLATSLECVTVSGTAVSVPANTYGYGFGVACPAGYGSTNAGFQAAQKVVMADGYMGPTSGNFFVYNLDSNAQVVTPWVHCCRVPGR